MELIWKFKQNKYFVNLKVILNKNGFTIFYIIIYCLRLSKEFKKNKNKKQLVNKYELNIR